MWKSGNIEENIIFCKNILYLRQHFFGSILTHQVLWNCGMCVNNNKQAQKLKCILSNPVNETLEFHLKFILSKSFPARRVTLAEVMGVGGAYRTGP